MKLYVVRHAEAVPLEAAGVNADADRPLTDHGHAQCRALAPALLSRGVTLDLVLTSPYLRARQTAQGLLDHWPDPRPRVEECAALAPDGRSRKLARTVHKYEATSIALVGHQPDLAAHVAWLMGSKKVGLDMEKSGVAYLDCDGALDKGCATLQWLITPEWFMDLSGR